MPRTKKPKCSVCATRLTEAQVAIAASRGQQAMYCTTTCRETARKRRYRASK